jgi:hypothetical protein
MKKALNKKSSDAEMADEYDFSGGIRGKYSKRFAAGSNVVVLSPDVAQSFPDSQSVNEALRLLMKIAARKSIRGHRA